MKNWTIDIVFALVVATGVSVGAVIGYEEKKKSKDKDKYIAVGAVVGLIVSILICVALHYSKLLRHTTSLILSPTDVQQVEEFSKFN